MTQFDFLVYISLENVKFMTIKSLKGYELKKTISWKPLSTLAYINYAPENTD